MIHRINCEIKFASIKVTVTCTLYRENISTIDFCSISDENIRIKISFWTLRWHRTEMLDTLYINIPQRIDCSPGMLSRPTPMGLSTYELSIDLSRPSRCFLLYRRVNRLSHPLREGGRWDRERGQPRHSGFVPLIVRDNSAPLSRYADLSRRQIYIFLHDAALDLNSRKFSGFIVPDLVFTTRFYSLSKLRKFSKNIPGRTFPILLRALLLLGNECYVRLKKYC